LINSLLGSTKQVIAEVSAVALCMVVHVSDLLSDHLLDTMPQENTGRKWIRKTTEHQSLLNPANISR